MHSAGMIVVSQDEFRALPGLVALHRAGYALARGDLAETASHARRVLDLAPEDDILTRGGATALMGLAAWASGDLETAYRSYSEGMADVERGGHLRQLLAAPSHWRTYGSRRVVSAMRRVSTSRHCASRANRVALPRAGRQTCTSGSASSNASGTSWRRDAIATEEPGARCESGFAQNTYRWRLAMARVHEAQGDFDGALDLLSGAQPPFMIDFSPNVRPIAAVRARVLVRQGRSGEALDWAREHGLSANDDLSYLREYEHITLARALLASGSAIEAAGLLDRLLEAAERGGRSGKRDRNPGAAGARASDAGRHARCAGATGARPDPGRARGILPRVCGRRTADGGAARRQLRNAGSLRATFSDCWPNLALVRTRRAARQAELDRAAE